MAYLLNSVDLYNTYEIRAGHTPRSNISLQGCFDMPKRIGVTYKDWGDSDSVEPWVAAGEIMFAGRDIVFSGSIQGTVSEINTNLQSFYDAINAATGISIFETPYNSASGYVKSVNPKHVNSGCTLEMVFREPVVALTGTLPASGSSAYTIDSIPFSSFGLYLSKAEQLHDLPEIKEQFVTKYGQEGYQIVKRKNKTLDMNGFVAGSSLGNFITNVQALYKVFSSSGTRSIVLNTITTVVCFATEGFKIENIHYSDTGVIAKFHIDLIVKSVTYYEGPGYCDETVALLAGMDEQPSTALADLINTTIEGLKTDGVFALGDCLYVRGVHTSQAATRNWIKNAHHSTLVNSPTFTAKEGFQGNGSSSYINNNFNPQTEGVNFVLKDYSIVYMDKILGTTTSRCPLGAFVPAPASYLFITYYTTTFILRAYLGNAASYNGEATAAVDKYIGYSVYTSGSDYIQAYEDGVITGAARVAAQQAQFPNCNIFELARSDSDSPSTFYNGQRSFSFFGASLSTAQQLALYNRMVYFYANVGGTF